MNINDLARSYTSLMRAMNRFPKAPWMDALSHAQLQSKAWAVTELVKAKKNIGMTYIMGGWLGMLGPLLFSESKLKINKIRSFDIDPSCEQIADQINIEHVITDWKYKAVTKDMFDVDYDKHEYEIQHLGQNAVKMVESPDTIINTSCDHIEDFSKWWNMIPKGKLVLLQNNNFKHGNDKNTLNTIDTVEQLLAQAPVSKILFDGFRDFAKYRRFMLIGVK